MGYYGHSHSVACTDFFIGGSTDSQREFLEALSTDDSRRQDRQSSKQPPVANNFALGYTYHDVLDADHEGMNTKKSAERMKYLTLARYSCSPLHLPTLRSIALVYSLTTTSSHTSDNTEYAYSYIARLVTTMVLAQAIKGLGAATQNSACVTGF